MTRNEHNNRLERRMPLFIHYIVHTAGALWVEQFFDVRVTGYTIILQRTETRVHLDSVNPDTRTPFRGEPRLRNAFSSLILDTLHSIDTPLPNQRHYALLEFFPNRGNATWKIGNDRCDHWYYIRTWPLPT